MKLGGGVADSVSSPGEPPVPGEARDWWGEGRGGALLTPLGSDRRAPSLGALQTRFWG